MSVALLRGLFRRTSANCGRLIRRQTNGATAATASLATIQLDGGTKLKVTWKDGQESTYHARWLRHNCKCPQCWEPSSGQKILSTREMQGPKISLNSASISSEGSSLVDLDWMTGDGHANHQGCVDLSWLKRNAYDQSYLQQLKENSMPHNRAESLPVVQYNKDEGSWLWSWMYQLSEYGMCLLNGVPVRDGQVKEIAEHIGPIFSTHYEEVFYVMSQDEAVNIAYTERELPLHVDLVYLESPPGVQLLHCLKNDPQVVGGESVLLDGWAVVEQLRKQHPQHFDTLTKIPATFDKVQKDRAIRHRRPHIVVDRDGTVVQINWSPQNHGPLAIKEEEIEKYYQAYNVLADMLENSEMKVIHLLRPGEMLTFNNRRVLHSRTEYKSNGGMRQLQGTYVSSDHFKSRVRMLAEMYATQDYTVKSVFNGTAL